MSSLHGTEQYGSKTPGGAHSRTRDENTVTDREAHDHTSSHLTTDPIRATEHSENLL